MGKRLFYGFLVVVLAFAATETVGQAQWLAGLESAHYDFMHLLAGERHRPQHVVIAAIDEQTRLEHQDEPLVFWAPHFAQAIEVLKKAGVKAIGLDFLFSVSAEAWLKKLALPGDRSRTFDLELRRQLASGPVFLAASMVFDDQGLKALKDKVVIVALETRLQDIHLTPYARSFLSWRPQMMSGPEVHANIVETLLTGRCPRAAPELVRLSVLLAVLAPLRQAELRREDLDRFGIPAAAALYQELLAPALSGAAPGARLIIVPDGVLGAFPFEALVVQAGPDWGKSVLVADRWPITYVQSAAILTLNRLLGASKASQPFFALGDCIYEPASPRYQAYKGGQGQAGALKHLGPEKALTMSATGSGGGRLQFPPLPQTRQTVTELANRFQVKQQPPQVLLDVQASETGLRRTNLGQFRYLFFGTHGFLADNLAGIQEPTLVLSQVENQSPDNGFLTLHKVLQLNLDADLVTLAACMTGVGQVTKGEGVSNFARAFQQAGARSVMVALWNIPVEESMKFFQTFYQALPSEGGET